MPRDPYRDYRDPTDSLVQEAAKREMVKGILWLVGAGVVTLITYSAASDPGSDGSYYVFWGAMAYGGYRFLRAVYYWFNPAALKAKIQGKD